MAFDLNKLIKDVFNPQPNEQVVILCDYPINEEELTEDWRQRHAMADQWRNGFLTLGARCLPVLRFQATGANNGDLPEYAFINQDRVSIKEELSHADIVLAFTKFSATAPLSQLASRWKTIRVASMPGVLKRMEETALAADYHEVARRADLLAAKLSDATSADIVFTTGHRVHFDLRFRQGEADNGRCHREQTPHLINLPSGEGFIVPYEGERAGEESLTKGEIPVSIHGETIVLMIENNRIKTVQGTGPEAIKFEQMLNKDPARRNVAELGLGCNTHAIVTGNVLEDEKAGMHWAYGRSEHIGGITGPDAFTNPSLVLHNDIVYAPDSPIGISSLTLKYEQTPDEIIMKNSLYTLFD